VDQDLVEKACVCGKEKKGKIIRKEERRRRGEAMRRLSEAGVEGERTFVADRENLLLRLSVAKYNVSHTSL
jgi:hypothetical protein